LNIWKVTPADAMLTPGSSRASPGARLAAIARNDSRRFSATAEELTPFSIAQRAGQKTFTLGTGPT